MSNITEAERPDFKRDVGICRFCGQSVYVEVGEDVDRDGINAAATAKCECYDADIHRREGYLIEQTRAKMRTAFADGSNELFDPVTDSEVSVLDPLIVALGRNIIAGATITIGDVKYNFVRTDTKIKFNRSCGVRESYD